MNSPKIQLLTQGFATSNAQSAKISKVSKMKRDRDTKITQKCGIMKKAIKCETMQKVRNLRNSSKNHLNGQVIPRVAWES